MKILATPLMHAIEGRVRLKLLKIKGNDQKARDVEFFLSQVQGVENVVANPVTGNVLIFYHPQTITQQQIIRFLIDGGYLPSYRDGGQTSAMSEISEEIVTRLATAIIEATLTRLLVGIK